MTLLPLPDLKLSEFLATHTFRTSKFSLDSPVEIALGLYQEKDWRWITLKEKLVAAGYTKYKDGYDGRALFVSMKFDHIKNVGEKIGFKITLPNSATNDGTGVLWSLHQDKKYKAYSAYWNSNLRQATDDDTWLCDLAPTSQQIVAYCFNFMPVMSGLGTKYRFDKGDPITL